MNAVLDLVIRFVRTQQTLVFAVICTLLVIITVNIVLRQRAKQRELSAAYHADAFIALAQRDAILIDAAITRLSSAPGGINQNRANYIQLIGYRLDFLFRRFKKAHDLGRRLGIAGLCATNVSSFITGSQFFGHLTVGLSFTITSIGAAALAIATFLQIDTDSINSLLLAERLRLELTQYVGSSSEYATLDDDAAYFLFAETVDRLLMEDVTMKEAQRQALQSAKNAVENENVAGDS